MSAPPEDAPPPEEQDQDVVDAGFEEGPPVAEICGFVIPSFNFSLTLNIPFPDIDFPPKFFFSLGINCDADNPFDISGGVEWGGGRKPTPEEYPDPDDNAEA